MLDDIVSVPQLLVDVLNLSVVGTQSQYDILLQFSSVFLKYLSRTILILLPSVSVLLLCVITTGGSHIGG